MGVPGPKEEFGKNKRRFSDDVFKVELSGPSRQNLSIIDIPGIFRNVEDGVTTKDDVEMVNEMVQRWIKDDRTIILAVININNDIATQEVISVSVVTVLRLKNPCILTLY